METECEALKIADSIAESAKSARGDLQKTQARRDGDLEHGGSAATPTPMAQLGDCDSGTFWRRRLSWAPLREELVANGTPVVQRRR